MRAARGDDRGAYQVSDPSAPGFAPIAAQAVELRSNFTRSVILQRSAARESGIVVTAARAIKRLNTANAEISASLVREQLVALPNEGRDVDAPQLGIVATVTGNNEFHLAPLRLDHRLTACACRAPEALTCGPCARRSAHRGPPSTRLRSSQAVRP